MRVPDASHFYQHLTWFNFSNSSGCIVVSHWYCHLHLSKDAENIFRGLLGMSIISFVNYVLRRFAHFPDCFICGTLEDLNVCMIKKSPLWNILYVVHIPSLGLQSSDPWQLLEEVMERTWLQVDLWAGPLPTLSLVLPGLEAASRTQPWENSVLLKSSAQYLCQNPVKALILT